jgi:hypothetical protein
MDIEVVIEGVSDSRVVKQIKRTLHRAGRAANRAGEWSVLLAPSEERGVWDLGVRGPFGRHFVSFTADAAQLPALVAVQLRACF